MAATNEGTLTGFRRVASRKTVTDVEGVPKSTRTAQIDGWKLQ
jgi:hypothetical protein